MSSQAFCIRAPSAVSPIASIVVTGLPTASATGMMHDRTGYTPYAGRTVTGWPQTVMRRGDIVVRDGELLVKPGTGVFLPRTGGEAAKPTGRLMADMDPEQNFGARLL